MFLSRRRLPVLAAAALALGSRRAGAHAVLVESQPAHRARVASGKQRIVLRFNSRIDRARSRLTLLRPGGGAEVLALLSGPDDMLAAEAILVPGEHTLRWQVLAVDGHITRGDVPFTVAAP